ncbi:GNAT family N-acetyltransferase [Aquimarina longa]|uniref:GNAT family N-acetyltransferase n=1 Tax=Aquimarina longa TaxID=1080221 RepID=UPI000780CAAF|nr:GNAT family N-acetyltransferase [Aquimarina longa]
MEVKNLSAIDFSILMNCFLKAFENYYVKMPTDHEYYKKRWQMANVRLELSYGMFDKDHLVGFIINAIDERNGNLIAFNTGTGVLPEYRGQRIISTIYKHAISELKTDGITKCRLEVITENTIAIKVYEFIGFKIIKSYKCYNGAVILKNELTDFELKKVNATYFDWATLSQDKYSWDNHIKTLKKGNYHYYTILVHNKPESYFVIHPENGYVAQFNILNTTTDSWNRLFAAIRSISETIKINNVDEQLTSKITALNHIKLKNTVNQFEMELNL